MTFRSCELIFLRACFSVLILVGLCDIAFLIGRGEGLFSHSPCPDIYPTNRNVSVPSSEDESLSEFAKKIGNVSPSILQKKNKPNLFCLGINESEVDRTKLKRVQEMHILSRRAARDHHPEDSAIDGPQNPKFFCGEDDLDCQGWLTRWSNWR